MAQVTIYMPDGLHEAVKAAEFNLSAVCQAAAKAELERMEIMSTLVGEMKPREVRVDGRKKRFTGRRIGAIVPEPGVSTVEAFLTAREQIAVTSDENDGSLDVYEDFESFAEVFEDVYPALVAQVAAVLGEEWTEELDI